MQQRGNDPQLGRFAQADTIIPEAGDPLAWDRYAYVNNNPLTHNDPSGHCVGPLLPFCIAIGTFIVDNAGIVASVAVVGAITSFVGPSNPDTRLINDPEASRIAFENSLYQSGLWLGIGSGLLAFGNHYSFPQTNSILDDVTDDLTNNPIEKENITPDFLVSPNGDTIIIPSGAKGPYPADSGKGIKYIDGFGTNGLNPRAVNVRIMDPTKPTSSSPGYPGGYIVYYNNSNQSINPYTGNTISKTQLWAHMQINLNIFRAE